MPEVTGKMPVPHAEEKERAVFIYSCLNYATPENKKAHSFADPFVITLSNLPVCLAIIAVNKGSLKFILRDQKIRK